MEFGGKIIHIFSTFKERFRTVHSRQSSLASKTTLTLSEQQKTSEALLVSSFQTSDFLSTLLQRPVFCEGQNSLLFTHPRVITENTSNAGQQ